MRELLLSIASPESLSWIGFLILALGLLGEVGVYVLSPKWEVLHGGLVFAFVVLVLVGYLVGHIGDDAISARFEARATNAELELTKIKEPRTINPNKRPALIKCLKVVSPKGPVIVAPKIWDWESEQFGKKIEQVLKEADFDPKPPTEAILSWSLPGTFLLLKSLEQIPPHAAALQACFKSADILFTAGPDNKIPEGAIMLAISTRL